MNARSTAVIFCLFIFWSTAADAQVCQNQHIRELFQTISTACEGGGCKVNVMEEINSRIAREDMLGILSNPALNATHIFFPTGQTEYNEAVNWTPALETQLRSLRTSVDGDLRNTIVFVVGKASPVGNRELNIRLSRARAIGVIGWMRENIPGSAAFNHFHAAWAGDSALQLTESDTRRLRIEPGDYRHSAQILNQAVHVFIYPCADRLSGHLRYPNSR